MQCHQVFSRRDQLSLRCNQKVANKEKKGTGKGRKTAKAKEIDKTKDIDETPGTGKRTKKKTKGKETPETETKRGRPKKIHEPKEDPAPKRIRGKTSTEASTSKRSTSEPNEPKRQATKKNSKEKVTSSDQSSRRTRSSGKPKNVNTDKFIAEQKEIVDWITEKGLDYNNPDLADFKKKVRKALTKFEFFAHNIYWTTNKCGLTMWTEDGKTDVATFSFDRNQRATLIAIACADLVATRHLHVCVEPAGIKYLNLVLGVKTSISCP